MEQPRLIERVEILEGKVSALAVLPDRVAALEQTVAEFRVEVRSEFAAVRVEMRTGDEETRQLLRESTEELRREMRELTEDTKRYMLVLHEDVIERIKTLGEAPRPRRKRR
jgi:predicted phage gp36 major capsid-like protein